jgi:predicted Co/Zn/Cd cation transporter (cation efflux family)
MMQNNVHAACHFVTHSLSALTAAIASVAKGGNSKTLKHASLAPLIGGTANALVAWGLASYNQLVNEQLK